jgi:hypothetical protein
LCDQDRYGVGLINTQTNQLLPWRTRLWDDNLQFVGGIQRIYAGDIAPNDHSIAITEHAIYTGGKALHWNPGSNSFEGNKAMEATPRGLFVGGDGMYQGGRSWPRPSR